MKRWSAATLLLTLLASAVAWALIAACCIMVGSAESFGWPSADIMPYRREPVLLASLVGAALAAAGVAYQAVLRNPLADPYLLGASSGAMLFAYLWQLPALSAWIVFGEQAFAFAGALSAVGIVFALASRGGRLEPVTLLLVGVIVNAVNGAIFLLLNAIIKDPAAAGGPLTFLVGGLQTNLLRQQEIIASIVCAAGWIVLLYFSGDLNVGVLSDAEAQALGVRIHRLRWLALVTASLITASAVAVSGPIGFVGLVCPHLARLLVGNDQRKLLPIATAMGASLLAVADALSRMLSRQGAAGTKLPVGVLTGLLGGPFFLILLWQTRKRAAAGELGQ
ncbi:MAG TPA: iron ABC transporter permease [Tepidisphaeraceae bacterium]